MPTTNLSLSTYTPQLSLTGGNKTSGIGGLNLLGNTPITQESLFGDIHIPSLSDYSAEGYTYIPPEISDRSIDVPSFAFNYTPSKGTGTLEWDQTLTPDQVRILELDNSYKEFTYRMYQQLKGDTDIARRYTQAFHQRRAQNPGYAGEYVRNADGTYKYIKGQQGIFRADGSIDPDLWADARVDSKWGLVHMSGFGDTPPPPPEPTSPELPPEAPPQDPPTGDTTNPFTPVKKPTVQDKKSRWTDWIPILSKYFANGRAARRDAALQKQIVYPKKMPKERHAIKTDAYLQRQLLEKQKQEIIARGDAIPTSNMEERLRIMDRVNEIADKYSDKQALLQSQEYQQTSDDVTKALNYNTSERVDAANHNLKVAAAARNNIVNAERNKLAKLTSNWNNTVDSLYHNYGKWLHDQRVDERRRQELSLGADLQENLANIEQQTADLTNPKNWQHLARFASALSHRDANLNESEAQLLNKWRQDPITGLRTDAAYRHLIVSKLESGEDPISTRWRGQWTDYVDRVKRYQQSTSNGLRADYRRALAGMPTFIDNQIWTYTPSRRESSLMKEGGKVKLLKELAKRNQQAKEQHDKNFNEAQKREADQLREQLDALDKEQLLLLKAMFK